MFRENWFSTPVWVDQVSLDYNHIAKKCVELKESGYPHRIYTNRGGWQSENIQLSGHKFLSPIEKIINAKIAQIISDIGDETLNLNISNFWININERGDYNEKHVHSLSSFSGVLYIQVDSDTGEIRFFDDLYIMKHYPININPQNKLFHHTVEYKPINGLILIFPSWLSHDVKPSRSDNTRISMSFNLVQV